MRLLLLLDKGGVEDTAFEAQAKDSKKSEAKDKDREHTFCKLFWANFHNFKRESAQDIAFC